MKTKTQLICFFAWAVFLSPICHADTVGVFFNPESAPIKFAADDIKTALEKHEFTVEMLPLNSVTEDYPNKKIVISLAAETNADSLFKKQGGKEIPNLTEQAYALRTTEQGQKTYWVFGGDINGAMYGGLQIAENLTFDGFSESYQLEETPVILKRGIKLNLPLDKNSGTYDTLQKVSDSAKQSIPHVWDMSFWTTWFDEMARHRYNVVSIWNNHPFTSMIHMPDYPDVAIQDVTGYDGYSKKMSIDEKIDFWRKVMAYAHSRGFEYYMFSWNLFTYGATGKYGITDDENGVTNPATIAYMRKAMSTLLETYPDLDGFGVTQGEHMSEDKDADSDFMAKTYGMGTVDYMKQNPARKLRFIHRWHMADFSAMKGKFAELINLPNVSFDISYKYSRAHMFGTTTPRWLTDSNRESLEKANLKSWLTVRNDTFFFHHWGDPEFVRSYIDGIPDKDAWFRGVLIGSDGFIPTRVFYSKHSITQGMMEIQRRWYMHMLLGRLSYNPTTPDAVFIKHIKLRFPTVSAEDLFTAWGKASRGIPKANELVQNDLKLDFQWWPEACQSHKGFVKVQEYADANPAPGSQVASISDTAEGRTKGRKSSYDVANEIEKDALSALALIESVTADPNTDLGVTINHIRNLGYLSLYYVEKIRAATHLKAKKSDQTRDALGKAYSWWIKYSSLMDSMYEGMSMQRSDELESWRMHDNAVLKEFTDLGGKEFTGE